MENTTSCANGGDLYKGLHSVIILSYFWVGIQSLKVAIALAGKLQDFDDVWAFSVGGAAAAPFEAMVDAAGDPVFVKHADVKEQVARLSAGHIPALNELSHLWEMCPQLKLKLQNYPAEAGRLMKDQHGP